MPSPFSELHEFEGQSGKACEVPVSPGLGASEVDAKETGNEPENAGTSDESDSSSLSSGCLSSDDSDLAEPPAKVKRIRARIPEGQRWYVHIRSHLVHRFDGDVHNGLRFLVCGKRLTDAFTPCTEASAWNVLCKSCNRRQDGA